MIRTLQYNILSNWMQLSLLPTVHQNKAQIVTLCTHRSTEILFELPKLFYVMHKHPLCWFITRLSWQAAAWVTIECVYTNEPGPCQPIIRQTICTTSNHQYLYEGAQCANWDHSHYSYKDWSQLWDDIQGIGFNSSLLQSKIKTSTYCLS